MAQETINQRLKILIELLGLKVGSFSRELGVSETTVRNYIDRGSKPGSDFLEKLFSHFRQVNITWLVGGVGDPLSYDSLLEFAKEHEGKRLIQNIGTNAGVAKQVMNIDDCKQSLEIIKRDLEAARKENELLKEQLASKDTIIEAKDALIAAKEEMLILLRGGHNRVN